MKHRSLPAIPAVLLLMCVSILLTLCGCAVNQNNVTSTGLVNNELAELPAEKITPIEPNEPAKMWVVCCDDFLSLRTEPIPTANCAIKLMDGDIVEVIGYEGSFAYVDYQGTKGYVLSGFLVEEGSQTYERDLSIVNVSALYSYNQMLADIEALQEAYPDELTVGSIGTSVEGRDIPVLVIGDPSAPYQVVVSASIHGREYMTACLAMAQAEYLLNGGAVSFEGSTIAETAANVCFHIIPMANPDGTAIAQSSAMTDGQREMYEYDLSLGDEYVSEQDYLTHWKANSRGVDLNRNFAASWEAEFTRDQPSGKLYKGTSIESEPESRALASYTRNGDFDAVVSLHSSGSLLYWSYGSNQVAIDASESLAQKICSVTGYPLYSDDGSEAIAAAGYCDWTIETLGIASVTIETGSWPCPLAIEEFSSIWVRNRFMLPAVAQWVKTE